LILARRFVDALTEEIAGATLPARVRERVAIHEAGHATVAVVLGLGEPQALTVHDAGGSTETAVEPRR
jgi:hypothetical protein